MPEPGRRAPTAKPHAPTPGPRGGSALDRPAARVVALGIALLAAAALGWIHRDDLFPQRQAAAPAAADPVALCLAARAGDIERMRADGVIDATQAALFKSRAEALCQAQQGQGGRPPPGPGS